MSTPTISLQAASNRSVIEPGTSPLTGRLSILLTGRVQYPELARKTSAAV